MRAGCGTWMGPLQSRVGLVKLCLLFVSRKSKSPPKVPIVIQDDSLPTGPPPQIRILKRPCPPGSQAEGQPRQGEKPPPGSREPSLWGARMRKGRVWGNLELRERW